ncbi:CoA transferase [Streptomyces sp. NBC_01497]|uniref:CoA transferase n=1 Tax=Streptomyces sp. NBC_01497 TaxID=2903885 RepID=UPI002E30A0D6|nr:CoA transferase [Streptomyces sp. NBC_01497]
MNVTPDPDAATDSANDSAARATGAGTGARAESGGGPDAATATAWQALGGPPELLDLVSYEGADGVLPSRLPVRELARATVGAASLAAAELLAARRGDAQPPAVVVKEGAVATAFVSERHLRIDGRHPSTFAPLSRFWPAADGWVRTHANYPHHRARLLRALGVEDIGDDDKLVARVANVLAGQPAEEIQEAVYAGGGLAVRVAPAPVSRTLPLVEIEYGQSTGGRNADPGSGGARPLPPAVLPAQGVRVLDLTRVIAGPVATRTLALLGADVLRVDSPRLPETPDAHADTGMGKRSTLLDLAATADRATFDDLLDTADVLVTGYRPGALDRLGLSAQDVRTRRPGLVVAQLCAWGWSDVGPWTARRGFDSLVQAGTGIAATEAADDGTPGVLPAQALDHGTGYLLAAAVLRCLTTRGTTGTGARVRLSLAGTAQWLLHGIAPDPLPGPPYASDQYVTEAPSPEHGVRHALPPLHYEGAPTDWRHLATPWGSDTPNWL